MFKLTSLHRRLFLYVFRFTELGIAFCFWGWLIGFLFFSMSLDKLSPSLPSESIDTIVVFTGGEGRVQTGITLLKRGVAKRLFISGVRSERQEILPPESDKLPITLGYAAKNTFENVEETVAWLKTQGLSSVCLVTAEFHMPRSLFLLRHKMPHGIFYPYPLKTPPTKRTVHALREYHKLIACVFFQKIWKET